MAEQAARIALQRHGRTLLYVTPELPLRVTGLAHAATLIHRLILNENYIARIL